MSEIIGEHGGVRLVGGLRMVFTEERALDTPLSVLHEWERLVDLLVLSVSIAAVGETRGLSGEDPAVALVKLARPGKSANYLQNLAYERLANAVDARVGQQLSPEPFLAEEERSSLRHIVPSEISVLSVTRRSPLDVVLAVMDSPVTGIVGGGGALTMAYAMGKKFLQLRREWLGQGTLKGEARVHGGRARVG
jgi:hypothetical protein